MKQKQLLIYLFLLLSVCAKATDKVSFYYDEAGNRISRRVVTLNQVKNNANPKPEPVAEEMGERKVVIFPNPTKGNLAVEVTGGDPKDEVRIELYSAHGTLLQNLRAKLGKTPVDLSTYDATWYVLRVSAGTNRIEFKIIKQ
ncbi:MAG: T9SS type A sorting domain-containing protein [Bacteroidales bacterium]|nr:T9SS type A sorting domain-containing protein [Bacteroidales bacterium]